MSVGSPTTNDLAPRIERLGRGLALAGMLLPLLFIGGLKFTRPEIEALTPLIGNTPWLSWLGALFGDAGASYFLGVVEITAALLVTASFWSPRLGLTGAALAAITFFVTSSLLALPVAWDSNFGGFPALSPFGQFVIKDVALLGVALVVTGELLGSARAHDGSEQS